MIGWRCGPHIRAGSSTRTPSCSGAGARAGAGRQQSQSSYQPGRPAGPRRGGRSGTRRGAAERLLALRGPLAGDPAELPLVRDGRAGVQDEGSQLVTWALDQSGGSVPGWWLDLCAGPGGKSALLAGLARLDGSGCWQSDLAPHRARLVVSSAYGPIPATDRHRPSWSPTAPDRPGAPARLSGCWPMSRATGLGALRRRPESRWRRNPADVEQLHPLQLALLASAIDSAAARRHHRLRHLLTTPSGDQLTW